MTPREARAAIRAEAALAESIAMVEYKATIPKRMMEAQALATSLHLACSVSLTMAGPTLSIASNDRHCTDYYDYNIGYESEEWELCHLEDFLTRMKEEADALVVQKALAQATWAQLSEAEKIAIKAHIHSLR